MPPRWRRNLPDIAANAALLAVCIAAVPPAPARCGEAERIEISSFILHETRTVRVYLPEGYEDSTMRFPVFYKLDGEWEAPSFAFALERLAGDGRIPPMILVAVENTDRHRDMTPAPVAGHRRTGGADYFLDFLRRELIPRIDREYRTLPERTLFGHSLAGLLATYAFCTAPDLFDRYIATSPSLPHDLKKLLFLAEESFEERRCDGKAFYFATGTEDLGGYLDAARTLAGYFELAAPAELRWRFEALEGEDHRTAPFAALERALSFLYQKE